MLLNNPKITDSRFFLVFFFQSRAESSHDETGVQLGVGSSLGSLRSSSVSAPRGASIGKATAETILQSTSLQLDAFRQGRSAGGAWRGLDWLGRQRQPLVSFALKHAALPGEMNS